MVDLKERFQALDQVPAPNLERVIELREVEASPARSV